MIEPGRYRHSDGGLYEVIGVVGNLNDQDQKEVLFQSLADMSYWMDSVRNFNDTMQPERMEDSVTVGSLLPDTEVEKLMLSIFTQMQINAINTQFKLIGSSDNGKSYTFSDPNASVFIVTLEQCCQRFLSFAQDFISGKLSHLGIRALTDVGSYDSYALGVVVQYIIFGRIMYA